jgi:hypothetical protein
LLDQSVASIKHQQYLGSNDDNKVTTIHGNHGKFADIIIAQTPHFQWKFKNFYNKPSQEAASVKMLHLSQSQQSQGKHEWFCGRHWNLAYDKCMNCQKIRQCLLQGCVSDELHGELCLSHDANKNMQLSWWMHPQCP